MPTQDATARAPCMTSRTRHTHAAAPGGIYSARAADAITSVGPQRQKSFAPRRRRHHVTINYRRRQSRLMRSSSSSGGRSITLKQIFAVTTSAFLVLRKLAKKTAANRGECILCSNYTRGLLAAEFSQKYAWAPILGVKLCSTINQPILRRPSTFST